MSHADFPPNWPQPNYVNPEKHGPGLAIINIVLVTVVFAVLVLRMYARLNLAKSFGGDDVLMILAFVSAVNLFLSYQSRRLQL
jgi:hypothetical protein